MSRDVLFLIDNFFRDDLRHHRGNGHYERVDWVFPEGREQWNMQSDVFQRSQETPKIARISPARERVPLIFPRIVPGVFPHRVVSGVCTLNVSPSRKSPEDLPNEWIIEKPTFIRHSYAQLRTKPGEEPGDERRYFWHRARNPTSRKTESCRSFELDRTLHSGSLRSL